MTPEQILAIPPRVLTQAQREAYFNDGYILLPAIIGDQWVARLRAATTGDAPILLKMNMEAGHGGAAGRFDFLKEIAFDYAFAIWAVDRGWVKEPVA